MEVILILVLIFAALVVQYKMNIRTLDSLRNLLKLLLVQNNRVVALSEKIQVRDEILRKLYILHLKSTIKDPSTLERLEAMLTVNKSIPLEDLLEFTKE